MSPGNGNVDAFRNGGRLQIPLQIGVFLGRGGLQKRLRNAGFRNVFRNKLRVSGGKRPSARRIDLAYRYAFVRERKSLPAVRFLMLGRNERGFGLNGRGRLRTELHVEFELDGPGLFGRFEDVFMLGKTCEFGLEFGLVVRSNVERNGVGAGGQRLRA